jgi:FtsP/CotA-like multicopper oxidase with cupredoxin domain
MRLSLAAVLVPLVVLSLPPRSPTRVEPNDNRRPAGILTGDTLTVRLVVSLGDWYPESDDGLHVTVEAFGEEGRAPAIPAPLLRVRTGTVIRATVRNALPDSTIHLLGLATRPASGHDTVHVAPGGTAVLVFPAGEPGTYLYRAVIGNHPDGRASERETAAGAFVVDPPQGSPPDRVLVMNAYANPIDSVYMAAALAINGRSWPHTERIRPTVGDTLRWRLVNATVRSHPMHLHGFYFTASSVGDGLAARTIAPDRRPLEVTRAMPKWSTLDLSWSPDRAGNWLFHCHLTFHVISEARLDGGMSHAAAGHSADPARHMAGLVLGIEVAPRPGVREATSPAAQRLDVFVNQGGAWGRMPVTYSYILQRGPVPPSPDSVQPVGTTIVLTRGRAADIVVHNRAREPVAVHWHGLELGSWSDGVAGWSGAGAAVAPAIEPADSFTAHLALPRAGTFIYHTHLNDIAQVTGGAVGALLVLEPGERHDPLRDRVYLGHWHGDGRADRTGLLVNGDSVESAVAAVEAGVPQRLRFINIGPANEVTFSVRIAGTGRGDVGDSLATWRPRAKDGADLPPALREPAPATRRLAVGETADFEFTPEAGRDYVIDAGFGRRPATWRQRLVARAGAAP